MTDQQKTHKDMKCSWLTVDALVMSTHFILPIQTSDHFSDMLENPAFQHGSQSKAGMLWELWHPANNGVPQLSQTLSTLLDYGTVK